MERTNTELARRRRGAALSQEGLTSRAGVPQSWLSRIEKHGPTTAIVHAIKVARALDVSVEVLFADYVPQPKATGRERTAVHSQPRERKRTAR